MSIQANQPLDMASGETYQCPHCHSDILTYNQPTHDAICARRHAAGNERSDPNNQRSALVNQRPAQPQMIQRDSSSGGYPELDGPYSSRRPQVREERSIANNKLITCPNCEKSVREKELNNHVAHECQGNDKIPCEFCDQAISMSSYTHHIEDVHRREREEEQERHAQRHQQQEAQPERAPRQPSNERPPSQERPQDENASQGTSGGFMGFLKNLMHTATQHRAEPMERPREVERHMPSEQSQSGSRSLLSRLMGSNQYEERSHPMTMEDFFTQSLQGRQESQRPQQREQDHPFFSQRSQNPFASQPSGSRSVRTIRLGPHGTLIISSGQGQGQMDEEQEDVWQSVGRPQRRMQSGPMQQASIEEMGPRGLLLQMLAARGQGMPVAFNMDPEQLAELEQKGLSKEDIESLSVVKYDAAKNKNLSEDMKSCPICLDEFEDGIEIKFLWCLHRFHKKCIDQWLEKNTNCPICKKDFSEMNEGNFAE